MTPSQAETVAFTIRAEMNALDPAVRAVFQFRWGQFTSWCRTRGYESAPAFPPHLTEYRAWLQAQEGADAVSIAEQAIVFTNCSIAKGLDVADVADARPDPPPDPAPPARRGWWKVPRGQAAGA